MPVYKDEEARPLTSAHDEHPNDSMADPRHSLSNASTTSLILDSMSEAATLRAPDRSGHDDFDDVEEKAAWQQTPKPVDRKIRIALWIVAAIAIIGWTGTIVLLVKRGHHLPMVSRPHNPEAQKTVGSGKKVTLDQVLGGEWRARSHHVSWIEGTSGEDGLLMQRGGENGRDYLVVEDVRNFKDPSAAQKSATLMKERGFYYGSTLIHPREVWPNKDHKHVLIQSHRKHNFRHSSTGLFWLWNVESQSAEPLDPHHPTDRIQLATWSPNGDSVVFTRDNNMYLRKVNEKTVTPITKDGGEEFFYGIPDWVYEEEVFHAASGTWWSGDGKYIAYLRTNETSVPTFPVQYFFHRPTGEEPEEGEEAYPDVREIKYPKAGAPMSVVSLLIYDVAKATSFEVQVDGDFADDNRLITEVTWAGTTGQLLIKNTNRESDHLKVILVDAEKRHGHTVREQNIKELDGGWYDLTHNVYYIPADPANGRPHDGYIDQIPHEGFEHLAYFTPLDNSKPVMLTSGKYEVVKAPSAVDLEKNLVYFVSNKEESTQRHVYSVKLDGTGLTPLTDTSKPGYYDVSFSAKAGHALLSYQGPGIPWQKVIPTPSNDGSLKNEIHIEDNEELGELARSTELPLETYQTVNVDGFELNLVERRPPHFDPKRKYPVLFWLYNGPGYQQVDRKFTIDFQSYIASTLGYIVVTLDGRGTGYKGRAQRMAIRGNIGYWESHDQIAAAKMWAAKDYVDASRLAIWGWSYGGFLTLKVLEQDAGQTFKYGMSVAPVTDWRYYDSVYTERYMFKPQNNPGGYDNATVSDVAAMAKNTRFLVMHGFSDDNVHFQNTLSLLDKLDEGGVTNYDVHVFPDSDHSIYFHGAHPIVYQKLSDWLVNAFNGDWARLEKPMPLAKLDHEA